MHTDIMQAFFQQLSSANLGYPIAWPNTPFTPPNSGNWLEVLHQPNQGIDQSIAGQSVIRQGLFTVIIKGRKDTGLFTLNTIASQITAVFPKVTPLGNARVVRVPYVSGSYELNGGIIELPLTVAYSE